jgi:primosomal protein N''
MGIGHVGDRQLAEHLLNALADLPQRLANSAAVRLVACTVAEARCHKQRPINRDDHFERRNFVRTARKRIAAARAVHAFQQAGPHQPLQDLGQRFLRNAISIGKILGATRSFGRKLSQVPHGDEPVIGLLGQL